MDVVNCPIAHEGTLNRIPWGKFFKQLHYHIAVVVNNVNDDNETNHEFFVVVAVTCLVLEFVFILQFFNGFN